MNAGKSAFDGTCPVWHATSGTTSWSLALNDNLFVHASNYAVSSRATDVVGWVQDSFGSDAFAWDGSAPNAAFAINSGSANTASTSVTLNLTDASDVDDYRAAQGTDCSAASWTLYSGTINFTIAATQGSQSVCLEVRDSFDNASSTATDTISLDTVKPDSTLNLATTLAPSSTVGSDTSLSGTASDATSGVASVSVSIQKDAGASACLNSGLSAYNASFPNWVSATGTTSWSVTFADSVMTDASSYVISTRATDSAGNVQTSFGSDTFGWDSSAPSAVFSINAGSSYTGSTGAAYCLTNVWQSLMILCEMNRIFLCACD